MNLLASLLLTVTWNATAVRDLQPPQPGVCAMRFEDPAQGLVAVLEKRETPEGFVTALAVTGAGVRSARLVTPSADTAKMLKKAAPRAGETLRAEALLGDDDALALLVRELSTVGGRLEVKRAKDVERFELPHPLPHREVVSKFLFCTRDLILPKVKDPYSE